MKRRFALKRDLIRAFAGSMNLISSEVENHHEKVSFLEWAARHHEKLNGKGYPFHLHRNELSLGARIMTIAVFFSALAEDRPYRKGMEKEKVIMILREDAQNGYLSDKLVALLTDHYDAIDSIRKHRTTGVYTKTSHIESKGRACSNFSVKG